MPCNVPRPHNQAPWKYCPYNTYDLSSNVCHLIEIILHLGSSSFRKFSSNAYLHINQN
jgi:hypothetical protein